MIIVLAGQKEREALMSESQSLVDEVERQIGLKRSIDDSSALRN
jgi:hypothetical protein